MTEEIIQPQPTPEGQAAVAEALQAIKDRSFSGRHPELGKMINCHVCHDRHRQNERNCQIVYHKIDGVEQIAGETKSTKFDTTFELDIQRKQTRQVFGAKLFKGRRKNRRNKPTKPTHHWVRLIQEKHVSHNHLEGQ